MNEWHRAEWNGMESKQKPNKHEKPMFHEITTKYLEMEATCSNQNQFHISHISMEHSDTSIRRLLFICLARIPRYNIVNEFQFDR